MYGIVILTAQVNIALIVNRVRARIKLGNTPWSIHFNAALWHTGAAVNGDEVREIGGVLARFLNDGVDFPKVDINFSIKAK